jgi:hypothetical protein
VFTLTLRIDGRLDEAERRRIEAVVRGSDGTIEWRSSDRVARTYALIEFEAAESVASFRAATVARIDEPAIIALAVFPAMREALPGIVDALAGPGRPAGVTACDLLADGVAVEFAPAVTAPEVVLALVDVELARLRCGRVVELLSPLALDAIAAIAACGLQAPEITADRTIEQRLATSSQS